MHPTLRPLIHPQPEKFRRLPIDRHRYTLARVCRAWGFARSLIYRRHGDDGKAHRPTPGAPRYCEDAQVAATLRKIIAESPFPAERHRKLWARLRRAGVVVSRERVRRILRDFAILPQP